MPHPACRHASVCFAPKNLFGTISITRPAKRTDRLRVRAATKFCCCRRLRFCWELRFFAGQAVISANPKKLPTGGPSHSWFFGGRYTTPLPMAFPFSRSIGSSFRAPVQLGARLPFHHVYILDSPAPKPGAGEPPGRRDETASQSNFISHWTLTLTREYLNGTKRTSADSNRCRRSADLEPHGTLALISPRCP